jgi:hypothetical protein
MRIFLFIVFLLLAYEHCFSQQYELRIKVSDGFNTDTVRLGFDPAATNGIDPGLGETELPPVPPTGVFDARLYSDSANVPLGEGVKKDYRPGTVQSGMSYTAFHKIKYKPGSGTSIRLTLLGFPQLPPTFYHEINFKDFFGGVVVNTTFIASDTGSILISNLALDRLLLTLKVQDLAPVELSQFQSSVSFNDVFLRWQTNFELNNRGFEVHRKTAESDEWQTIGFVNGAINSNGLQEYEYADRDLNMGSYNYRLKQIDINGNFEYFLLNEIVTIARPAEFALEQNYPNPFNPATTISFQLPEAGTVKLSLYDAGGKLVRTLLDEFRNSGNYDYSFDGSSLPSGVYYYSLESGDSKEVKSMVLLK